MGKKNVKGDNAISVKLLTVKDSRVVRSLDFISCFSVEEWLDDNTDYAWGIFKNDELIGYCTIGIADDMDAIVESHPEHTVDALRRSGINTLGQLTQLTESDLKKVRNLGPKCCEEIKELLEKYNLQLSEK